LRAQVDRVGGIQQRGSIQHDLAFVRRDQAGDGLQRQAFARARWPEQYDALTG
jgi:hypothetical protein